MCKIALEFLYAAFTRLLVKMKEEHLSLQKAPKGSLSVVLISKDQNICSLFPSCIVLLFQFSPQRPNLKV